MKDYLLLIFALLAAVAGSTEETAEKIREMLVALF